ncbi:MAG: PQQ-dependent sugar dehydrogenase [Gemmatimonadota bacterium]|nr:MAG: PQQ-dependent sugar dehydrogenase [Gemmatimonadota bacterium]
MPLQSARLQTPEVRVESIARDLEVVWGLAVAPDGRVFLSERPGRIRVIDEDGGLRAAPWARVEVFADGEAGLLGLALHPAFPDSPFVYVVYSHLDDQGGVGNRVSRIREEGGRGGEEFVILEGIAAGRRHAGGAIAFGPDGKLYIGTGDVGRPARAQDPNSTAGKILRINPDGSIPDDNPFWGSAVFALGLRNVQGFDWDPETGRMVATMHGPSGEWARFGRDELNVIEPGANYGWPRVLGAVGLPGFTDPWLEYGEAIAPAAAVFYRGPIEPWDGDFFFATLSGEHLHRVLLAADRSTPEALERLWPSVYGRVRALAVGPDGALYFGTSNQDGRGHARPGDDQVFRVTRSTGSG